MRFTRKNHILGKISVDTFLKKYWQKKPLLIRNAIENFQSPITKKDLLKIAQNEESISRLIEFKRGLWQVKYGPFKKSDFPKKKGCTLDCSCSKHESSFFFCRLISKFF